jgi:predicted anti-sigma-YlaC factor YlaD
MTEDIEKIECSEFEALIVDYMEGDSTPDARRRILLHLQSCRSCAGLFWSVRRTVTYCRMENCRELPPEARNSLWDALHREFKPARSEND